MGALQTEMIEHMRARGYATKTIKAYTSCVRSFARHFRKSPLSISAAEIERFFLYLREERKSESTVHIYYEGLRYFYAMKGLRDLLPRQKFRRINNRLPVVLSQRETQRLLLSCASLKYRTIFTLIYSAGLRVSEAAQLRIKDVDFERRQIFVRNGKNGKDRPTLLAQKTIQLLRTYLQVYRPLDALFYGNDISRHISVACIQKKFRQLVERFGFSRDVHVHTLRHCFATHLLENGTSIFHIMHLLGHSNIQTTMVYLHMGELADLDIVSPVDHFAFGEPVAARHPELLLETA